MEADKMQTRQGDERVRLKKSFAVPRDDLL